MNLGNFTKQQSFLSRVIHAWYKSLNEAVLFDAPFLVTTTDPHATAWTFFCFLSLALESLISFNCLNLSNGLECRRPLVGNQCFRFLAWMGACESFFLTLSGPICISGYFSLWDQILFQCCQIPPSLVWTVFFVFTKVLMRWGIFALLVLFRFLTRMNVVFNSLSYLPKCLLYEH